MKVDEWLRWNMLTAVLGRDDPSLHEAIGLIVQGYLQAIGDKAGRFLMDLNRRSSKRFVEFVRRLDSLGAGTRVRNNLDERHLISISKLLDLLMQRQVFDTKCGGLKGWPMRIRSGFLHPVMN